MAVTYDLLKDICIEDINDINNNILNNFMFFFLMLA